MQHAGPNFATFLTTSTGTWRGHVFKGKDEPAAVEHVVSALPDGILEQCAGGATLQLDKSRDGFSYFSLGSWALAPPQLDAGSSLIVCLCADNVRHRLSVPVAGEVGLLGDCEVTFEGKDDAPLVHEDFNAGWRDAKQIVLTGTLSRSAVGAFGDFAWTLAESVHADDAVRPKDALELPYGSWVSVGPGSEGLSTVVVGAVTGAEARTIAHTYDPQKALQKVCFTKLIRSRRALLRTVECAIDQVLGDVSVPNEGAYWLLYATDARPLVAKPATPGERAPIEKALLVQLPPAHVPPRAASVGLFNVGTRLLHTDERVNIWEFALAPGERCAFHTHTLPYCFINLEVSRTQALDAEGAPVGESRLQTKDQVTFVSCTLLGSHGVLNVGNERFLQFIVELK